MKRKLSKSAKRTLREAGVLRCSWGVGLGKCFMKMLEEYMDKKAVNKLLNLMHADCGGRTLCDEEISDLIGPTGCCLPGIVFLVTSLSVDNGGFLSSSPDAESHIPEEYGVGEGSDGHSNSCADLRAAAQPFFTGSLASLKKKHAGKFFGCVQDPTLMLSHMLTTPQFGSLRKYRTYVLVGNLHPYYEEDASPMSWPTSQEAFFPLAAVLGNYSDKCLNYYRAYQVLQSFRSAVAAAAVSSEKPRLRNSIDVAMEHYLQNQ